ncbi:hypothetical protein FSP39_004992, partial [Pinctada imbricata]
NKTGQFFFQAPPSIYYIPNFVSKDEEENILHHVYSAPKPKWTQLSNRRLQNWGGLPHPKGMVTEDIPQWLTLYIKRIADIGIYGDKIPNHVLVNEYQTGQGIMPHEDGPLFYPTVSTISLGSHTLLDFYYPMSSNSDSSSLLQDKGDTCSSTALNERYFCSVLLEPRSLLLVCDDMYKVYLHGIAERTKDVITNKVVNLDQCTDVASGCTVQRTTRVSLTIRHVQKILKSKVLLGKR